MQPLTAGLPRVARGFVVAVACLIVSMSGHVLAGEPPAATATFAVAVAVLTAVCVAASRWRWTFRRLLLITTASEPAFHVVFELGAVGHAGHGAHAGPGVAGGVAGAVAGLVGDPLMLAGHAGAALVLALLLARGEAWVWALAERLTCSFARCEALLAVRAVPPPAPAALRCAVPAPRAPRTVLLLPSAPRRGPPAALRPARRSPALG